MASPRSIFSLLLATLLFFSPIIAALQQHASPHAQAVALETREVQMALEAPQSPDLSPASPQTLSKRRLPPGRPGRPAKPQSIKYFHEPGRGNRLGHYDARYFKGMVEYDEHRPALRHLIRSYLTTFRALGIETWLAHGTLLGWWWNGKIMPWDYDLDVQVADLTLFYLAKHYNRTTHTYRYRDEGTGEEVVKEYLLDINPNHSLPRGDGRNIIDARWIDTSNGMFIDITGLSEREPKRMPGIWSCKNYHRYRTRELYPMRETEFEGVPATIPYSFDKILTDEYGKKALVTTEWQGHKWNAETKEWEQIPPAQASMEKAATKMTEVVSGKKTQPDGGDTEEGEAEAEATAMDTTTPAKSGLFGVFGRST